MPSKIHRLVLCLCLTSVALATNGAVASAKTTIADVREGLEGLTSAPGGPPGAIATLYKGGRLTAVSVGRADVRAAAAPKATEHMRTASVSKAFSGAVALHLVEEGKLSLDATLAELLPSAPAAWGPVTLAELLHHTSGVPDYTTSKPFAKAAGANPRAFVTPAEVVGYVKSDPLEFAPGTNYAYSNTDNILVGLIVERATGRTYGDELEQIVFGPAHLGQTSFPVVPRLPKPFIHGYVVEPHGEDVDVSEFLSPSGAWASGAIVSTPTDLNAFIRADLGRKFFGHDEQSAQMQWWPGGESSPPGPGKNSAGLALFRYQTRCGTVYGHTGNFPGYVQFAAATADGSRALTTTLNIPAPKGKLLARLRSVQATAVCALMGR